MVSMLHQELSVKVPEIMQHILIILCLLWEVTVHCFQIFLGILSSLMQQDCRKLQSDSVRSTVKITDLLDTSDSSFIKVDPSSGSASKEDVMWMVRFLLVIRLQRLLTKKKQTCWYLPLREHFQNHLHRQHSLQMQRYLRKRQVLCQSQM